MEAAVNPMLSPDETWAIILKRDPRFDGQVFYGVRSTGIYCRPSCPSRRPRREQVTFFSEPDTAEQAGLRAGRRRGGEGMEIRYAIADSPLGRLLVAATEKGVSAVSIGDSDSTLKRALLAEYPKASVKEDERAITHWVKPIVDHLSGKEPHLDLP